ncbi:MAG: radical SAM protein [Desulfobacterales bacterium]|nr:radical SAM protein [Desulfobacterales bacterium]
MTTNPITARRIDWARQQLAQCRLCPRACGADRLAGETGWCGTGAETCCFMEFVHYGEEPGLVPSHTLYLSGCNLDCLFCHTHADRRRRRATPLGPENFREIIDRGKKEGAVNINLLGGEPLVNLPALVLLFSRVRNIPRLIWNSNLYCTGETLEMLRGIPDLYLVDLKFGAGECAKRLARAADYPAVVMARLRELARWDDADVIIRHLVLPGHLDCCTAPVLHWIAEKLGKVRVSLRLDYLVTPRAGKDPDLGKFLSGHEKNRVEKMARDLGLNLIPRHLPTPVPLEKPPGDDSSRSAMGDPGPDVEFTISPNGELFIQHPTRRAMSLALNALDPDGSSRPE